MEEWKSRWQLLGFVGVMGIYREGCGSLAFGGLGLGFWIMVLDLEIRV